MISGDEQASANADAEYDEEHVQEQEWRQSGGDGEGEDWQLRRRSEVQMLPEMLPRDDADGKCPDLCSA